jgi:hypothetical protein
LESAQKAQESARVQQLALALEKLENIVMAELQPFRMTPITVQVPLTDIATLRATIVTLCGQATQSVVKMLLPRIRTAFDGIVTLVNNRKAPLPSSSSSTSSAATTTSTPFVFQPPSSTTPFTFSLGKR